MSNSVKPLKKAGLAYGTGKWWHRTWSGISGESDSERSKIQDYAKDAILDHMFMTDIRKLLEEFNLPDLEEKSNSESDKGEKEHKSLKDYREYARRKIKLSELENYLARDPSLRNIVNQNSIRASEVANYAGNVASIRQEIHWTITNVIDEIKSDNRNEFEPISYATYWLKQLNENIASFRHSVRTLKNSEKKLARLGFKLDIFATIVEISQRCDSLYISLYRTIESKTYSDSDLIAFGSGFYGLDDELVSQLKRIRYYAYGMSITYDTRSKMSILIDLRNRINDLFLSRYKFKLLEQDEKSLEQISKDCFDSDTLFVNLAALGTLIDGMNVKELKRTISTVLADGSINALEGFLIKNLPDYDKEIITNLRTVMKIRNQWPIHNSSSQGTQLVMQVNGSYPVKDPNEFWAKIFNLYTESLRGIEAVLNS